MKKLAFLVLLAAVVCIPGRVNAGGYDTPILYSARHLGMGGTAISYVNDPSALFHNPAGLGHTEFISVTADFSPLIGGMKASPEKYGPEEKPVLINTKSERVFAPFFLLGASFRVTDWLTLGVGAYPVASAAASYKYSYKGNDWEDLTKLVFIEIAPGLSVDLPWNLRLGATYRLTMLQFDRVKGADGSLLDIHLKGTNFAGFKVGLQWQPIKWLQAGIVYRHKTVTEVSNDSSQAIIPSGKTSMEFTLPSKLGIGVRADVGPVGMSADAEYGFNNQNVKSVITAEPEDGDGTPLKLRSQFRWQDSVTLRGGLEYSVLPKLLKLRAGYIFDGKVANEVYPSAFGTPPTPTHSITAGVGTRFDLGKVGMEVNLAYAYRFGSVQITESDLAKRPQDVEHGCDACGYEGEYKLGLHGIYVDTSLYF